MAEYDLRRRIPEEILLDDVRKKIPVRLIESSFEYSPNGDLVRVVLKFERALTESEKDSLTAVFKDLRLIYEKP